MNDNISDKIHNLSDFYFIVHLIINKLSDNKDRKIIPELCYLLDKKSLLNLITYFEGETITIPTKEEIIDSINLIELYYQINIKKVNINDAIVKVYGDSLSDDKKLIIATNYINISKYLEYVDMDKVHNNYEY